MTWAAPTASLSRISACATRSFCRMGRSCGSVRSSLSSSGCRWDSFVAGSSGYPTIRLLGRHHNEHSVNMGFLQATLDLTGTKFTQEALGGAQESLADLITRYDPLWLSKPLGPLGWYWQRSDLQSMCFLINLAETVNRLQYNVTKKSVKTLMDKFRKLLRAKSRREFEETLLELQFARALCEWVSPIAFDPFVPTMLADPGKRPRSSDFAIRFW